MESGVGSAALVGVLVIGEITAVVVDTGRVGSGFTAVAGVRGRQLVRPARNESIAIAAGMGRRTVMLFSYISMNKSFQQT